MKPMFAWLLVISLVPLSPAWGTPVRPNYQEFRQQVEKLSSNLAAETNLSEIAVMVSSIAESEGVSLEGGDIGEVLNRLEAAGVLNSTELRRAQTLAANIQSGKITLNGANFQDALISSLDGEQLALGGIVFYFVAAVGVVTVVTVAALLDISFRAGEVIQEQNLKERCADLAVDPNVSIEEFRTVCAQLND